MCNSRAVCVRNTLLPLLACMHTGCAKLFSSTMRCSFHGDEMRDMAANTSALADRIWQEQSRCTKQNMALFCLRSWQSVQAHGHHKDHLNLHAKVVTIYLKLQADKNQLLYEVCTADQHHHKWSIINANHGTYIFVKNYFN